MSEPKPPAIPMPPPVFKPFDVDAAIAKQLDKVPADHSIALVATAEKVGDGPAKGKVAMILRDKDGTWSLKAYLEGEQHKKPTYGAELIFSK